MVITKLEKPFGIYQLPDGYDPKCCLQVLYRASYNQLAWIPAYQNFIKYFEENNLLRQNIGDNNLLQDELLEAEWQATIYYVAWIKYLIFETPEDKLDFVMTFG